MNTLAELEAEWEAGTLTPERRSKLVNLAGAVR